MTIVINKNTPQQRRGRPPSFDRNQVLDRAVRTFWELGYEGASINDLTAAMGITPQSLYAAFGSKSALYHEVLARYQQTIGHYAVQALEQDGSVVATFEHMLKQAAIEYCKPKRPRGCMISTATLTCSSENKSEVKYVSQIRNAIVQTLKQRIDQGIELGEFIATTDSMALARYLGAIVQGMSVQALDGATKKELLAIADMAITTIKSHT